MNDIARLERDLATWLSETAMPRTPDYADEILEETTRIHQRPRWTFLGRWVPIPEIRWSTPFDRRTAVTLGLLIALGLLLAAVATFVASRRPALPAPFGLAGNGLIASSEGGDIVLIDAKTGVTRTIVAGREDDDHPRWSLDGTRIAFLRQTGSGASIVIADAAGAILAVSDPMYDYDTDTIRWSPDGTSIAVSGGSGLGRGIHIVDAATGGMRRVASGYLGGEFFWRPPDGRQLVYVSSDFGIGLAILDLEDRTAVKVETGDHTEAFRLLGWTPDGRRVVFQAGNDELPQTVVVDADTGAMIHLDVAFGHVSNDGTRIAGIGTSGDARDHFCVISITGGTCEPVPGAVAVDGTHGAAVNWSPDDRWITILGEQVWVVDPLGVEPPRAFPADGPGSWQRIEP